MGHFGRRRRRHRGFASDTTSLSHEESSVGSKFQTLGHKKRGQVNIGRTPNPGKSLPIIFQQVFRPFPRCGGALNKTTMDYEDRTVG